MKVFKSIEELAKELNVQAWEIEEAQNKWIGRNYMYVGETEVMIHVVGGEMCYILFDKDNNEDCKEYMMTYEIPEYVWKVYVDDIEGWQKCKVINISNTLLGINRATALCESGTQLNRRVKFVLDEDDEDFKADGCIYYYEDLED